MTKQKRNERRPRRITKRELENRLRRAVREVHAAVNAYGGRETFNAAVFLAAEEWFKAERLREEKHRIPSLKAVPFPKHLFDIRKGRG